MHADFELDAAGNARPAGSTPHEPDIRRGRPTGYSPKQAAAPTGGDEFQSEATKRAIRKSQATIELEEARAKREALKYEIESGNYLPRDAYREASATLLAELAQGIRSIPDLLERKANLNPEQVALAERAIDDALSTLSHGLAMFTERAPAGT